MKQPFAFFDLDHTLLSGDSDVLWCEWLMREGLLERDTFAPRNVAMEAAYKAGTVGVHEFSSFYVGTLAGRSPAQWAPLRQRFLAEEIAPRIPAAAHAQVRSHQQAGHTVVLTTATNRVITELTAAHLGIEHLIATEPQMLEGRFTGKTSGVLNMRQGKVERLQAWLDQRGLQLADLHSTAYSDSINDLPLLESVTAPVCTQPDAALERLAHERAWPVLRWF
jgi:HAD superfamily hydrolase (TIGR01490 family)